MKKIALVLAVLALLSTGALAGQIDVPVKSAVLMEKETGRVLFEKNAHEQLPPASVTKVMTMLLTFEALDRGDISLDDQVQVSELAASMGGSQIWLKVGETMSVDDMLKCIAVVSANDCSVAMAEHVAGSNDAFVARMNQRAEQLGMEDTTFKNCNGLDQDGHVTSAMDIAIMSRELLKYPAVRNYTTIWMDTVRNGEFGLSNTNKLLKSYNGTTGLKTGSTSIAKYCLSATAERDGMELIATIMAADTTAIRFDSAKQLLDFGFGNYALVDIESEQEFVVPVKRGVENQVAAKAEGGGRVLAEKTEKSQITSKTQLAEDVSAPITKGQKLGELTIYSGEDVLDVIPIVAVHDVERITIGGIFDRLFADLAMK